MKRRDYINKFTRSTREWEGIHSEYETPPPKRKKRERKTLRKTLKLRWRRDNQDEL